MRKTRLRTRAVVSNPRKTTKKQTRTKLDYYQNLQSATADLY